MILCHQKVCHAHPGRPSDHDCPCVNTRRNCSICSSDQIYDVQRSCDHQEKLFHMLVWSKYDRPDMQSSNNDDQDNPDVQRSCDHQELPCNAFCSRLCQPPGLGCQAVSKIYVLNVSWIFRFFVLQENISCGWNHTDPISETKEFIVLPFARMVLVKEELTPWQNRSMIAGLRKLLWIVFNV